MHFSVVATVLHILFCVFVVKVTCWAVDDYGCRTPDRAVGTCVVAKECKSFVNFLKEAPKPLPTYIQNKLRDYACGFQGRAIKVCCPEGPIPIPLPRTDNSDGSDEEPINDTDHRNLRLLPEECGYTGIPNKISYGENAMLGEYPWMALLLYNTSAGPKFKCGGTVISSKYILTAAHCIKDLTEPLIGVRVGEFDTSAKVDCEPQDNGKEKCAPPVQDLAIEEIIPHSRFTTNFKNVDGFNDIGLLRVSTVKITPGGVQPICLPTTEESRSLTTKYYTIAGWGYTEKELKVSKILQKASLPLISQQECQDYYKTITISSKQICANGNNKDSCKGDSGGPLQTQTYLYDDIRSVQYGIISYGGKNCGGGKYPGIYTKVDSYLNWILDNIRP